jgi:hypothetical protein
MATLYKILFIRAKKPVLPIFDSRILDVSGIDADDKELMEALAELRKALQEPHLSAPVNREGQPPSDLMILLNSIKTYPLDSDGSEATPLVTSRATKHTLMKSSNFYHDNVSTYSGYEAAPLRAPPPTEHTLPKSLKSDGDNVSMCSRSSAKDSVSVSNEEEYLSEIEMLELQKQVEESLNSNGRYFL